MNTTLKDVLGIFFRCRKGVLIFNIIVLTFTLLYAIGAKKVFVSEARVLIRLGQEQMGSLQFMSTSKNVYVTRREQELKNEQTIFLSDRVISSAAADILGDDASAGNMSGVKKYLRDHLDVKPLYDSDALSISFEFPDPEIAQKILTILISKYISHHIAVYENENELSLVSYKLNESRDKYDKALFEYTRFIDAYKIYDNKQIEFLVEKRNALLTSIANVKAEHQYHTRKLATAQEELKQLKPYQQYNTVEVINDRRDRLQSKLNEAKLEKSNLLQKYTPQSRLVLDINKEIAILQELISTEPQRIVDTVDSRKNDTYWTLNQTILDLKTTIAGEEGKIASLTTELTKLDSQLTINAKNFQQYTLLKKDLDLAKVTYEKYYEGFLESDLSNVSQKQNVTNISLVEEPSINPAEVVPNKKKIFIFAGMFLVAGNFFLVMLLTVTNNTVTKPEDITRLFGQQPVATFAMNQSNGLGGRSQSKDNDIGMDYYSTHLKDFQRFSINLSLVGPEDKVFLIGRSVTGEGGATICFNLAKFLANYLEKKIAFVDFADSRISRHAKNATPVMEGLFTHAQLSRVHYFQYSNNKEMTYKNIKAKYEKLDELRGHFDYIFCNVPPVKDSADLVFLNKHVDRVLFFVEAERTKSHVVRYNINMLMQYGLSKISLVLNKRRFYIPRFLYKYV